VQEDRNLYLLLLGYVAFQEDGEDVFDKVIEGIFEGGYRAGVERGVLYAPNVA
jgi:phosphoribosylaminoimidazole (AIR) synthetase